jgi:glutaredoxin
MTAKQIIARALPILVATAVAVPALVAAQQTVYKWVDKDGKTHYSESPPPADAKKSEQKTVGGGYAATSNLPYATQIAMKKSPVTLYTGADCGDACVQGRALLAKRGIPFAERDAQGNAEAAEALKKLVGGLDVPTLVVGEAKVKGFEEGQWSAALDGAGYPKTALPGSTPPAPAKAPPTEGQPPAKQ